MPHDPEDPFRILVIGDFSGRFGASRENPSFTPREIDRDNFDEVLQGMRISLELDGHRIAFTELDDFHPDRLIEVLGDVELEDIPEPPAPTRSTPPPAGLLDAILDEQDPDDEDQDPLAKASGLTRFVERITAPHLVAAPTAKQVKQEERRQSSQSDRLRAVLHHPKFQTLEASWRALFFLVRGLETDATLKIYVLDLSLPEFVANAAKLAETLEKRGPWALMAGNFAFGQSEAEVRALRRIAKLAGALEAPFIAEAAAIPDESAIPAAWAELRASSDAQWLGLAMPRFLLRLPYGPKTSPIDAFPFDEMPESTHDQYLWGNPSLVCALLLGQGFADSGWSLDQIPRRIDGLPLHVYRDDGESVPKPVAETLLSQKEAEYLLNVGFMPLATIKGTDAAILVRFQSIAKPAQPLAGLG